VPCLNDHQVSALLLGTLPSGVADESERHLLDCDRCVAAAAGASARDRLVDALQAPGDQLDADDTDDRSAISSLVERLGGWADDAHAPACTPEELQQILAPPDSEGEIGRLAHFRILEILGAGGMGIVFKAEDVELERIVALKVMRPALAAKEGAKRRFRREALAAAAFEHENIVTIYQVEEDRGVPFFSMQWLEGESLRERLRRREKLPVAEALRITREIATGLAAAHARGLLHRDIKPDNIWLHADNTGDATSSAVSCEPRVKIVDFGLVRSLDEPSSLTHSGMILGTPQYMAPEQACGEEVDGRSDLFSVGCVLYHMLTGRPPFVAPNVVATLVAVSKADVTPPHDVDPAIPRRVSDLTMRLLAREPTDRIASAAELARETAEIERDLPKLLAAPTRPPRRRRLLFGALAAGLAAIALGVIAVQTNRGTLVIEADQDVAVLVEGDAVERHHKSSGQKYELRVGENPLRPGEYEIVTRDPESGLEFSSREFAILRGDQKSNRVTLEPPREQVVAGDGVPPMPPQHIDDAAATGSARRTIAPTWPPTDPLSRVETTLGIQPGQPLSPLALVQNPRQLGDAISYTIEPADHRGGVTDAAFSPDGTRIATAGQDGTVRIYDARNFTQGPQQIIVCPGSVIRVVWSPTGKYLATAIESPTASICVWLAENEPSLVGKIYRSTTQLAWSPDEELLAFSDGGIQFWSLVLGVLPSFGVTGEISHRPWSADGQTLATLSHEGEIQLWEIMDNRSATRGASLGRLYKSPPVFAEQGNYLAALEVPESDGSSGPLPHSIHLWDAQTRQRVRNILLGRSSYANLAWAPDGSQIAAIGAYGSRENATLWDVQTGDRLPMAEPRWPLFLTDAQQRIGSWSPDGGHLLGTLYGNALLWDGTADTWTNVAGTDTESSAQSRGDYLAVRHSRYSRERGERSDQLDLWHLPQRELQLSVAASDMESFSLSPSGKYLAVVGPNVADARPRRSGREELDNRLVLHVYDTESGKLLGNREFQAAASLGA
jgi:eukaryotic-like serine/threonine-protein kinase